MFDDSTCIRFYFRVLATDGHWLWNGSKNRAGGYGFFSWNGKQGYAHRFSYELHKGPIPDGLEIMHSCDIPECVYPEHLFTATHSENMQDMVHKQRHGRQK